MSRLVVVLLTLASLVACSSDDPTAQDPVRDRLPALIEFVEQERGLEMRREVPVTVLDDEEFVERYRQDEVEAAEGYDLGSTYSALGLDDFDDHLEEVLDETLVGFYDAEREELVVRERPHDAYLDLVLVHELTHALQDQWFKVDRPELWDATERLIAFDSVVEGDAVRVERAWYEQQSEQDRDLIDEVAGSDPELPPYEPVIGDDPVAIELDFPYQAGLRFVDALLEQGGQERLDEAFRHPPKTTAQVLHPELMQAGPPTVPRTPQRDGEVLDQGTLGERGLALVLGIDPLDPESPAVGWDGDSFATYALGGQVCTAAKVVMRTAAQRDRLVAALEQVEVEAQPAGPTALELESCS